MDLATRVAELDAAFSGTLGVSAINLTSGDRLDYQSAMGFYPASTVKLPILYAVFHGALAGRWSLTDPMTLTAGNQVNGSGVLLDLTPGLCLSVKDVATLMIVVSDNTATNMLIDLCGVQSVNAAMADLGLSDLRLNRKIGLETEVPLGSVTPAAMARLMQLLALYQVLTRQACVEMLDILKRQKYKENTNRYIPESDSEYDSPAVQIASKSGWIRGVRNDVALIWAPKATYVLSMYSCDCKDRRFYHDNEGAITLARVSQAVFEAWGR